MPHPESEASKEKGKGQSPPSRGKLFYGWWIVLAGNLILFASSGVGFYGHGVILDPLRFQHGWTKGTVSSAITLYFITSGLVGMLIGKIIDTYGPKLVLILGSSIFALAFFLLAFVDQIWQLYAVYILMAIGWSGSSLLPVNTLITNWFFRKRGVAMSLTATGLSIGGMILVPLANFQIIHLGLRTTLIFLGLLYAGVIIPIAIFIIKPQPSDLNLEPDGELTESSTSVPITTSLDYAAQTRKWSRSKATKTVAFWSIVSAFALALCGQTAFLMHQVSFLSEYLGSTGAATTVSLATAASIMGRLVLGSFVDRFDKRYMAMACFLMQSSAIIILAHSQHIAWLYICTFAFGLTMGSMLMMLPLIIGDCFGMVSFGTISGLIGLFSTSGAAFGPLIAGYIFDATQSYRLAFILFAAMSLISIFAILFAKPPPHQKSLSPL